MRNNTYQLRYLPLFEEDLSEVVDYIANELKDSIAATRLVNDVESAILNRLENPLSFEPYHSSRKRTNPYYRIYVRNYTVYYVVIDNAMEVRRFFYNGRDVNNIL